MLQCMTICNVIMYKRIAIPDNLSLLEYIRYFIKLIIFIRLKIIEYCEFIS